MLSPTETKNSPFANGTLLKLPGSIKIYVVIDGEKKWISPQKCSNKSNNLLFGVAGFNLRCYPTRGQRKVSDAFFGLGQQRGMNPAIPSKINISFLQEYHYKKTDPLGSVFLFHLLRNVR